GNDRESRRLVVPTTKPPPTAASTAMSVPASAANRCRSLDASGSKPARQCATSSLGGAGNALPPSDLFGLGCALAQQRRYRPPVTEAAARRMCRRRRQRRVRSGRVVGPRRRRRLIRVERIRPLALDPGIFPWRARRVVLVCLSTRRARCTMLRGFSARRTGGVFAARRTCRALGGDRPRSAGSAL